MKIAIGSDHGGFHLKDSVVGQIIELGHEVNDKGTNSSASVDYPDYADAVCEAVSKGEADFGILICGTGIGMSMAANRRNGIRAALCHDAFTAKMSREHNDANILCLGERVLGVGVALDLVKVWLTTDFSGGRHLRRIDMF